MRLFPEDSDRTPSVFKCSSGRATMLAVIGVALAGLVLMVGLVFT